MLAYEGDALRLRFARHGDRMGRPSDQIWRRSASPSYASMATATCSPSWARRRRSGARWTWRGASPPPMRRSSITGESGCGKELIAQFIHRHSRRSSRPLIAVNCAALPEALLESEMFGHCKGAFTGAVRDKPGLLEAAHGGTLLLDELVEMSKPIQAKLLRVIQDGVVRRVGSEQTDAVVNVRFVCCTNRDPEEGRPVARAARGSVLSPAGSCRSIYRRCASGRPTSSCSPTISWGSTGCGHRGPATPLPRFSEEAVRALRGRAWKGKRTRAAERSSSTWWSCSSPVVTSGRSTSPR